MSVVTSTASGTTPANDQETDELLRINRQLLEAISTGDWARYKELCDPTITSFEPEAAGHLVEGVQFHSFYFDLGTTGGNKQQTMSRPHVRRMGDVAVLSYVRLVQAASDNAGVTTSAFEETRIWRRTQSGWKHVHFHRSVAANRFPDY